MEILVYIALWVLLGFFVFRKTKRIQPIKQDLFESKFDWIRYSVQLTFTPYKWAYLFAYIVWLKDATDDNVLEIVYSYLDRIIERWGEGYGNKLQERLKDNSEFDNVHELMLSDWFGVMQTKTIHNLWLCYQKHTDLLDWLEWWWFKDYFEEEGAFLTWEDLWLALYPSNDLIANLLEYRIGKKLSVYGSTLWDYLLWDCKDRDSQFVDALNDFCCSFSKGLLCPRSCVSLNGVAFWYDRNTFLPVSLYRRERDFVKYWEIKFLDLAVIIELVKETLVANQEFFAADSNALTTDDTEKIDALTQYIWDAIQGLYTEHDSIIESVHVDIGLGDFSLTHKKEISITIKYKYCFYGLIIDFSSLNLHEKY